MRFAVSAALLAAALVPAAAGLAVAQGDPIKERRAIMKAIGEQTDVGAAILKGQQPFDAAKAAAIFKTYADGAAKVGALFPEGSDKGETKATAAVWTDRAGFNAALAAFSKAVAENAGQATTEAGFKTAFTAVAETCRTCHRTFKAR